MRLGKSSLLGQSSIVLLIAGAVACTSAVDDRPRGGTPANGHQPGAPPGSGDPNTPPGGDPNTPPSMEVPVALPATGALGPVAVRRLSNGEYENTIQQLLQLDGGAAVTAGFLPDDRTLGYKNIAAALTVTPVLAEQYARAAKTLAQAVNVPALAPCAGGTTEEACAESFIRNFGRQAYRRPLTEAEVTTFGKMFSDERARASYDSGISIIVETMLQSPFFLYKTEIGQGSGLDRGLTPYELASQISYLVTGSMPDASLFMAADTGQLLTASEREAHVRRLMGTSQATGWLRSFVTHWLGTADVTSVAKDPAVFPDYEGALKGAIAEESDRFVDAIFSEAGGSLQTLFTANWSYTNGTLGGLYGMGNGSGDWQKTTLPSAERLGVLTHSAFLTAHSKADDSFPITRGKILRTRVMCKEMPPPPPEIMINPVEPNPEMTTRERFSLHAQSGTVCASCHTLIDPLGFGFENYDAIGAYRTTENGKPIDSSGEIVGIDPEVDGSFANALAFVNRVGPSQVLKDCVAREMFRWGAGRKDELGDASLIREMATHLAANNSDIRELLIALVKTEAYGFRSDR